MFRRIFILAPIVLCLAVAPVLADHHEDKPNTQAQPPKAASSDSAPASDTSTQTSTADSVKPTNPLQLSPVDPVDEHTELIISLPEGLTKGGKSDTQLASKPKDPHDYSDVAAATGYTQAQLDRGGRVARDAMNYRGAPYVWGATGKFGAFDCSGFCQYLYAKRGIRLPRTAKQQYGAGIPINRASLKTGDLVFFNTDRGPITHVGMYIGEGRFIHAANPRRGVVTNHLTDAYYAKRFAGARRFAG
jgi:cell wall-associated NlpC family hydrolase